MAIVKTHAITLKRVSFSNSSLILTLLTRDFGKLSVIAKGARREQNKPTIDLAMDLLSLSEIVCYKKSNGALSLLSEGHVVEPFLGVRSDITRWYAGYVIIETALGASVEDHQDVGLFSSTLKAIGEVSTDADPRIVLIRYFHDMLKNAGVAPSFEVCSSTGVSILEKESFIWAPRLGSSFVSAEAPMGEPIDAINTSNLIEVRKIWETTQPLVYLEVSEAAVQLFGKLLMEQVAFYIGKRPKSFELVDWAIC